MRYIDCTLTIENMESVQIEYIDEEDAKCKCHGQLADDKVNMLILERLNYWINYGLQVQAKGVQQGLATGTVKSENPIRLDDLKLIGLILYRILFNDPDIEAGFKAARRHFYKIRHSPMGPDLRLRLKLVFKEHVDKLSNLPWEFMFIPGEGNALDGDFFSGQQTEMLLTRYVPRSLLVSQLSNKREQLRILVAVCSPPGLDDIDRQEINALVSKMQSISVTRPVKVSTLHDLTYRELSDMINQENIDRATQQSLYDKLAIASGLGDPTKNPDRQWDPIENPPYHILHFIGHGEAEGLYLIKDPSDDDYDFDKGTSQRVPCTAEQFRKIFHNELRKPRMVFLHACKGAAQTHEGFKSTARQLVYAEIPAVVAMQYSISQSDAGTFAAKFYEELGKGKGIDEAVKEGRLLLGMRRPPWEHPRFGTPVVYLQSEIANEFIIPLPEQKPVTEQGTTEPEELPRGGIPPQLGEQASGETPATPKEAPREDMVARLGEIAGGKSPTAKASDMRS